MYNYCIEREDAMKSIVYAFIAAILLAGQFYTPAAAVPQLDYICNNSYVVRRGDSLLAIAKRCQMTLTELLAANPGINQSSIIYPGQVLRIVPGAKTPALPNTYTVQSGDTLSTIAERFDTTVKELIRVNSEILDPRFIYIDQVLRLPGDISGSRIGLSANAVLPGYAIHVVVYGFPANADIDFRIGLTGGPYTAVTNGLTNENGEGAGYVTFPTTVKAGQKWEVQVLTTEIRDGMQVISEEITISK
jgi:LysM repeat protein